MFVLLRELVHVTIMLQYVALRELAVATTIHLLALLRVLVAVIIIQVPVQPKEHVVVIQI